MNSHQLYHTAIILNQYRLDKGPLDRFVKKYFKENHSLGSKDRKIITEVVFRYFKWKGLLECHAEHHNNIQAVLSDIDAAIKVAQSNCNNDAAFYSCPEELLTVLEKDYSKEKAASLALVFNEKAPLTIRVNTLKTSSEDFKLKAEETMELSACHHRCNCFHVTSKGSLYTHPLYQEGLFAIQDEGSQRVSDVVMPKPGDWFLDYCAGAGGKTLAVAESMHNKGQIFLYDVREKALMEAKKRLKLAGVQNYQLFPQVYKKQKRFFESMDWVLVDAPCSGSGTYRRNPEQKWRFNQEMLNDVIDLQDVVFTNALRFVKKQGMIVYATCSILKEENEHQVEKWQNRHQLKLISELKCMPQSGGQDGFYAATLQLP